MTVALKPFQCFALLSAMTATTWAKSPEEPIETAEVMKLVETFNKRLDYYHGLEFEYEVSHYGKGSVFGEERESRGTSINRVRFMRPLDEGSLQYRVFWETTVENPGEPLFDTERITSFWIGFDGRETRWFDQTFFTEPKSMTASAGRIEAGHGLMLLATKPDCFLDFISHDLYGSITFMRGFDPEMLLGRFKISITGRQEHAGESCLIAEFEPVPEIQAKKHQKLLATNSVPMLLRAKTHQGEYFDNNEHLEEVTSVGEFEGIKYPATGYHRLKLDSLYNEGEFSVRSVRRLTPSEMDMENWFPPWPPGTDYLDEHTGRMTRIPYTPKQQDTIRRFMMERQAVAAVGWGRMAMMTLNLIAVGIIGYFVYRKIRPAFS